MKAIVHIGTPKTGTTSAQSAFQKNRDVLGKHGVFYPRLLGAHHHMKLATASRDPGRPERGFRMFGIESKGDHDSFRRDLDLSFEKELAEATALGNDVCLISSEWLYDRLTRHSELKRLKAFLDRFFHSFLIVVWLRPQVEVAVSFASTISRNGGFFSRDWIDRNFQAGGKYDYHARLGDWEQVFGAGRVRAIPYRRNADVRNTLLQEAGSSFRLTSNERENEKLGINVLSLGNAIRVEHANTRLDEGWNRRPYFQAIRSDTYLDIGQDFARTIQGRFAKGNEALTKRRDDLLPGDLDPDWSRYERPSNLEILEKPCPFSDELGQLLELMSGSIKLQEAQKEIALARLYSANADPVLARKHAAFARRLFKAATAGMTLQPERSETRHQLRELETMLAKWS
jgi:hypothetical protein